MPLGIWCNVIYHAKALRSKGAKSDTVLLAMKPRRGGELCGL
jgi:hypothetical protein